MKPWTTALVCCALGLAACSDEDDEDPGVQQQPSFCRERDANLCMHTAGCTWDAAGTGSCQPRTPNECDGLDEPSCKASPACAPITARPAADPAGAQQFIGCWLAEQAPGAMMTCTASGPGAPCWVTYQDWTAAGWVKWFGGCSTEVATQEECMEGAPFSSQ